MEKIKKCLIWDLDNTVWNGICLEGDVKLRPEVKETLEILDERGILHSISSRGEEDVAMKILKEYNLDLLFLAPKINWLPKSTNIIAISEELNIHPESIAFIDDDEFELQQIAYMIPDVMIIPAHKASEITRMSVFGPSKVTKESSSRRQYYQAEQKRKEIENEYPNREAFLKSCEMKLEVRRMTQPDIPRVLELMTRTHQLNTTGRIFTQKELLSLMGNESESINIMIAVLNDKFGSYGTVGVAILERSAALSRLVYMAISCRVLGRGIERAFLTTLLRDTYSSGQEYIEGFFRDTGRNKMMRGMYQMMGFKKWETLSEDNTVIYHAKFSEVPKCPSWVEVQ